MGLLILVPFLWVICRCTLITRSIWNRYDTPQRQAAREELKKVKRHHGGGEITIGYT